MIHINWRRVLGFAGTLAILIWIAPNDIAWWKMLVASFALGLLYPSVSRRDA